MARTKTTNRYTGAEINPPSTRSTQTRAYKEPTPPQEQPSSPPPPTSARPRSSRGKRPMTEEVILLLLHVQEVLGWTSLFNIKEPFYPELVKDFYANMYYHNGLISSYVRRRNVYLDAERIGEILGYTDDGLTVYTSGKWDPVLNLSYHDALACICTRISLSDGVTPTHKSLGPVYAQLHCIITHIILPQSGDQNTALPYLMFLTKVFKAFFVNLDNEPYEAKYSHLKGGGVVKRATKRDLRAERRALEEEERRARASTSRSRKSKGSGIKLLVTVVRELIQEVINMESSTSTAMEKSKSRARVLEKYLNKLEDDHLFSEPENEEDEEEHQDSQEEDDSDAN
ncbi:hypothetical protein PIB30_077150 [Stylosanthes scabra]|uniref:Putative plant transposon protein domain-containing protein n=1 Tax=Stylosanthes scabra TaxID=79078 RepID=A0ABU6SQM0_9FABA|nr:hypothetical protein [Stylosanthes scabra]